MGEERPNSQQATTPRRSLTQIECFALFLGPAQTLHPPSRACACARRRLSSRLDDIKKTACGDGHSHCLLCGAAFGLQGLAPVLCVHCRNVGGLLPPRSHREGLRGALQRSLHHRVEVSCGNERSVRMCVLVISRITLCSLELRGDADALWSVRLDVACAPAAEDCAR